MNRTKKTKERNSREIRREIPEVLSLDGVTFVQEGGVATYVARSSDRHSSEGHLFRHILDACDSKGNFMKISEYGPGRVDRVAYLNYNHPQGGYIDLTFVEFDRLGRPMELHETRVFRAKPKGDSK